MSIIGPLPVTLTNGSVADANQVMTDFNYIVSQINTNALPLAGGALTGPLAGTSATFSGQLIGGGTATNDNAGAGVIGEYISSLSQSVAAVNNVSTNITYIDLTAGDWDVDGNGGVANGLGSTSTDIVIGISLISATFPSFNETGIVGAATTGTPAIVTVIPTGVKRISLAAPARVYLVGQITFSGGTANLIGSLQARRAR